MWTVVYMAQSKEIALKLEKLLLDNGILVKIRSVTKNKENSNDYFEVLVPQSEVEESHSVIIEEGL